MKPATQKTRILEALTGEPAIAREISKRFKDIPAGRTGVMLSHLHAQGLVQRVDVTGSIPGVRKTYAYYKASKLVRAATDTPPFAE